MPPQGVSVATIVGAVATFFGITGLLAGTGFLVKDAFFVMLGAQTPPFATIDYLRAAGHFLFDLVVVIVLLEGVLSFVLPALLLLALLVVGVALWRQPAAFSQRWAATWGWIAEQWRGRMRGSVALVACLLLLVWFTFAYHYPVFAQRAVAEVGPAESLTCPSPVGVPAAWPLSLLWELVLDRCTAISKIATDETRLRDAQEIYANGALVLLALLVYTLQHPYSQLREAGRLRGPFSRWLWGVTAAFVLVSLAYLPGGYAVLFLNKEAPLVSFEFKDADAAPAASSRAATPPPRSRWRTSILQRSWYLVFQNDKEIWLYRAPTMAVLQKDQLAGIEIRTRHWIFP